MLYAFCCSAAFYARLSLPFKILTWLLGITFLVEVGAFFLAYVAGANLSLYNVFLVVQFLFVSLYFNYSIDTFRKKNIGIWIGVTGIILGILNNLFVQSLLEVNSYFILFAGISIISMSLYSFARLMLVRDFEDTDQDLLHCPQFWVTVSMTFFWSTSFLLWGMYEYFKQAGTHALPWVHLAIRLVNVLTYSVIGTSILKHQIEQKRYHALR